jgi:delta24(24(1))-sterol reductase
MFFMVRLPWFMLFFLSAAGAAKQREQYGRVSPEVLFILMAHFLYANACCKGEEMIVVTWDIFHEKWGFMLIFWNMSGVPLSYCHCTLFLAYHDPATYQWSRAGLVALYASYIFMYWVWDTSMSQRTFFRAQERGSDQIRNTFPQLPWRHVKNPQKITTSAGDSLLVDGWCKYARRIPYTCDVYFAVAWALVTGFDSPWPWFYPVFFTVMIVHRAYRDIERCKAKYGKDWDEYERRVPYLLIPVRLSLDTVSVVISLTMT